jgi:hypothetical protein
MSTVAGESGNQLTPLMIACPVCNAAVGHPCNTPTETGRYDVRWFHNMRADRASNGQASGRE